MNNQKIKKRTYNQLTTEQFQERIHKFYPDIDIIGEYVNAHTPIDYICNKCGGVGHINHPNSMMRGNSGCGVCDGRKLVKGKNDFNTIRPDLVIYLKDKTDGENVTRCSSKCVNCICPICGNERKMRISDLYKNGFSCPLCSDGVSYPNRFMYCLLKKLNIKFKREVNFQWSDCRIYDFVIEKEKLIIEMDGSFHKGSKYRSYDECKAIDELKDKMAINNGYKIIRIECYNSDFIYIKNNVLNSELCKYINLDSIDWVELETDINLNNLVKIASDIFMENKCKITIKEIAELVGVTTTTLCKLLKTGNRIGLNDYNPKISNSGGYTPIKNKQHNAKRVLCINTNQEFSSAKEATDYFGIKNKDYVARVCRGERESTNGLYFKYL